MAPSTTKSLVEALLAQSRTRSSWNDRLESWERPPSDHEEAQINRAANQVRAVLATNAWLAAEGLEIRPQGSYQNNTNVRLQADMDLCAWHPAIKIQYAPGVNASAAYQAGGYSDRGVTYGALFVQLRAEIHAELARAFGERNIRVGTKAFTVSGVPNSRAPVDVVPAIRLDRISETPNSSILYPNSLLSRAFTSSEQTAERPSIFRRNIMLTVLPSARILRTGLRKLFGR